MASLKRAYLCFAYYGGLSIFAVGGLLVNAACFLLRFAVDDGRLAQPARRWLQWLFTGWKRGLRMTGVLRLESIPPRHPGESFGEIYVSNHPSIMDATYLFQFIPNATCIYKHDIEVNPFYGSTARILGLIPNLGGAHIVRSACRALERGENLIVFPEGTRSTIVDPGRFKPGFALIAKRAGAVIRVLSIDSPDDFMVKERSILHAPRMPAEVRVSEIGKVDASDHDSIDAIMEAVRTHYRRHFAK